MDWNNIIYFWCYFSEHESIVSLTNLSLLIVYLYPEIQVFLYTHNADNLEPDVKAIFLSYPIPKAIVEEWEKVK